MPPPLVTDGGRKGIAGQRQTEMNERKRRKGKVKSRRRRRKGKKKLSMRSLK
tara:strand:- start:99 stop:254 length:156 start_codon:yes stop_codon:yes gene_type:complete